MFSSLQILFLPLTSVGMAQILFQETIWWYVDSALSLVQLETSAVRSLGEVTQNVAFEDTGAGHA